jgi:hypothetical protein
MIHVPDRPHVYVRLRTIKFFLRHLFLLLRIENVTLEPASTADL